MIPSNVDSRRSDKVQRYKPSQANGNTPGDDLTPDYMNILGPESTTANAEAPNEMTEEQRPEQPETWPTVTAISMSETPISPQYGIGNLPPTTNDIPSDTTTPATDTITETTAKSSDGDNKDLHSTPSRNDRFKVVKIASLEPFRRGRWKCMDYVDQTTPATTTTIKSTQSTGTVPLYMHTQSLPQHQIQQMLLQGGLPYFNIPFPTVSPNQYFYSAQPISNMPTQTLQQQIGVVPGNVQPPVFISTTQPYIQQNVPNSVGGFSVQSYPNAQYVPSNLSQNQSSAFIPTSQNVSAQMSSSFQPSQTFAGQPSVSQPNIGQPIVNGHAFPQQNDQVSSTLPTQVAKIAILNSQPTNIQNQVPQSMAIPTNQPQQIQGVPVQTVVPNQQYNQQIQNTNYQQVSQIPTQINQGNQQQIQQNLNQLPVNVTAINPISTSNPSVSQIPTVQTTVNQNPTSASQVVSVNPIQQQMNPLQSTNIQSVPQIVPQIIPILPAASMQPQFVTSVSNLVSAEIRENQMEGIREVHNTISEISSDNASNEDITKPTNPVAPQVNAIDNKIEQAMDLVKSHLMYTVREEVEILKEKITELMAKIQQLESENSFLKTQIPNLNPNGIPEPPQ